MGCPGLNNIKLPIKWPKSKAVKIVERSCDKAFSSLEQRGKELAYCSRPLGRIEKGGDLGLWSIHTEQKEPRWFQATWHQGKGHAKVTKSMISVFYVAVFTFFFYNQLALFKARGNVKSGRVPEIRKEWGKTRMSSLLPLVLQNMDNDFTNWWQLNHQTIWKHFKTPMKATINLGWSCVFSLPKCLVRNKFFQKII